VFEGGGTKQPGPSDKFASLDTPQGPSEPATTISTRSLSGIVLHDPLDGVAIVRSGTTLAELQAELSAHGQWLAVDPPFTKQGATIGGVFSANDSGPRRLAYGTLRDLVIGATVVTGDGVIAHSGGRVIKNVAGYDLARLYCGAFGTLGLVAELAVRLHPLRSASRTLALACSLEGVSELARAIRVSGLTPTAADWLSATANGAGSTSEPSWPGTLLVRFEERTERSTNAQADDLLALCRLHRREASVLDGDGEEAAWADVERVLAGEAGETVVRAVTRPSRLADAARSLQEHAREAGLEPALVSHALIGVHTACVSGPGHARVIAAWRSAIEALGGHLSVRRFAAELDGDLDRWGAPGDSLELMRRVKAELDPHNRCAPGTFVGGI
jgi:glycolate oxidase FAD binding subunit